MAGIDWGLTCGIKLKTAIALYFLGWFPSSSLGTLAYPSSCLFVDRSTGSRSFKDRVPKLELGNERTL